MHKIRLYVVPEMQEDEQNSEKLEEGDVIIDDIDLPIDLPPIMHRRNSRRPNSVSGGNNAGIFGGNGNSGGSTVRILNVIQKDRRNDLHSSLTPKLKQIGQQFAKNEAIITANADSIISSSSSSSSPIISSGNKNFKNTNNKKQNFNNNNNPINNNNGNNKLRKKISDEENLKKISQFINDADNKIQFSATFNNRNNVGAAANADFLKMNNSNNDNNNNHNKSVFASPRIKQLAVNLEEKMMERHAAKVLRDNIYSNVEEKRSNFDSNLNLNPNLSGNGDNGSPTKMIRNEKNLSSSSSSGIIPLSPIYEVPSSADSSSSNVCNRRTPSSITPIRNAEIHDEKEGRNNSVKKQIILDGRCSDVLPNAGATTKDVIKNDCGFNNVVLINTHYNNGNNNNNNTNSCTSEKKSGSDYYGLQNTTPISCNSAATSVAANIHNNCTSVILRRNNKLNRYREYDLEQKIEVEIKMREGSARLLAAARHRAQSLEAARALLTSNERMSAYMAELQRRKKEPSSNKPSLPVSNARVSLSDLRVPLMWRDSDHFKNRGDYRRFAVFCLARVGTEIHDTALLCPVDRALTDVTFPDVLVFNNVPAEFEVTLEIYSHILQEDLSIASTPRRIKRSIHSSISRTVGKKLAASLRDELNSGKIGPHFELMASARLTLDDTDDNIHTHDLVLNNLENKNHSLPLFGHFCCRLAAQPECITKEACSGNIILDGRTCWARIQGFNLQAWDSRKLADEELQKPFSTVPINRETLIQPSKSSSKELRISNTIDGSDKITTIRLESSEEAQKWVRQLVAHAKDHLRWRHAAEHIQDVPSVESARNSFISNKRQGSLYDETPLIESVQADFNTATTNQHQQRPTVQEIFGLTPSTSLSSCSSSTSSPPSLRSRSLSTSGSRKSGTNTLRSHWPFSNKNHD